MPDDRLIVAMDVPNVLDGLELAKTLGDSVSFYKIGLGMLTGGGLALANQQVVRILVHALSRRRWDAHRLRGVPRKVGGFAQRNGSCPPPMQTS